MTRIFISYRRADSEGHVGRLYDKLVEKFDRDQVFLDVGTIKPGEDFVERIEDFIGSCDALLAVIGPDWLDIRDKEGGRRLDNPHDVVRLEIASALKRRILVIPILVGRATMPRTDELPDDIAVLSRRNAVEVSHERFDYDVDRLVQALGGAHGTVQVLGPTDSLSKGFGLPPGSEGFAVFIDAKPQAKIEGGGVSLKVAEGTHAIQVMLANKWSPPKLSETLTFRIKGGQAMAFSFGMEYDSRMGGQSKLVLKPHAPVIQA